ncbi:MAG: PRC-barrel domain-containing protein [Ectothiorhodospiraceae bacterium]|nr:PRC-barrel domain-containing protein [Ectothiorhodospiraceae bacterium]
MKPVHSIALTALMAPAIVFGIGSVSADQQMGGAQSEMFMSHAPQNAIYADDLIGNSVKNRADDEEVGTVQDLILDQDGQIVGVIVGVGGFLGIGDKDVALSWDSMDRELDADGDEYIFRVDADEDTLEEAPEYERD